MSPVEFDLCFACGYDRSQHTEYTVHNRRGITKRLMCPGESQPITGRVFTAPARAPVPALTLEAFQERVFTLMQISIRQGVGTKSNDGAITVSMPERCEIGFAPRFKLELWCSVLGPSRHYAWAGETLHACLVQANADADLWEKELNEVDSEQ